MKFDRAKTRFRRCPETVEEQRLCEKERNIGGETGHLCECDQWMVTSMMSE